MVTDHFSILAVDDRKCSSVLTDGIVLRNRIGPYGWAPDCNVLANLSLLYDFSQGSFSSVLGLNWIPYRHSQMESLRGLD